MKISYILTLVVISLAGLAGCADSGTQSTTTTSSATMSSDSKNMTGSTVTSTQAPPPETTTTTDASAIGYPAIHSNGQH